MSILSPPDEAKITPKYVALITGLAHGDNKDVSTALAERKAGIEKFNFGRAVGVERSSFNLVDIADMWSIPGKKYLYGMYTYNFGPMLIEGVNLAVGALYTPTYGDIYCTDSVTKSSTKVVEKHLRYRYATEGFEDVPVVTIRTAKLEKGNRGWACLLVGALIVA